MIFYSIFCPFGACRLQSLLQDFGYSSKIQLLCLKEEKVIWVWDDIGMVGKWWQHFLFLDELSLQAFYHNGKFTVITCLKMSCLYVSLNAFLSSSECCGNSSTCLIPDRCTVWNKGDPWWGKSTKSHHQISMKICVNKNIFWVMKELLKNSLTFSLLICSGMALSLFYSFASTNLQ